MNFFFRQQVSIIDRGESKNSFVFLQINWICMILPSNARTFQMALTHQCTPPHAHLLC